MSRLDSIIETLPSDLQENAGLLKDVIAGGLLDNTEETVRAFVSGDHDAAYQSMISSLSVRELVTMLAEINNNLLRQNKKAEYVASVQHLFFEQLLTFAFSTLRKEIEEAL